MDVYVDVLSTCKVIKSLLDSMIDIKETKRVLIFTTIKVLCDSIEYSAKKENAWNTYTAEKMRELLTSCGAVAGIYHHALIPDFSLASTALNSLESTYLLLKERASEIR